MRVYPYPFAVPVLFLQGISSPNDGEGGFFQWIASESAPDDNLNVIASNWIIGVGRWDRVLSIGGAQQFNATRTVSTNTSFGVGDFTIRVDASGGAVTVILPPISGSKGRLFNVKKIDTSANPVTVSGDANIDNLASRILVSAYNSISGQSNGSTWDEL